jgi:hypothetical protein
MESFRSGAVHPLWPIAFGVHPPIAPFVDQPSKVVPTQTVVEHQTVHASKIGHLLICNKENHRRQSQVARLSEDGTVLSRPQLPDL